MTTRIPTSTILPSEVDTPPIEIAPNNNDVVKPDDPALNINNNTLENIKLTPTPSIYSTVINDRLNQKIIQITTYATLTAAGNIGDIQFNSFSTFAGNDDLNWDNTQKILTIQGNVDITNSVISSNITNINNVTFYINNSTQYQFTTTGNLVTPHYTFPYVDGAEGDSLITDGTGNLYWDTVSTPFSRISNIIGATGVVIHDVANGFTFNHKNIASNFTVNVIGLAELTNTKTITITLILNQSNPAYIPTALQIDGISQTVMWSDNESPIGFIDKKDMVVYNIFNISSTYKVYGHFTSYSPAV